MAYEKSHIQYWLRKQVGEDGFCHHIELRMVFAGPSEDSPALEQAIWRWDVRAGDVQAEALWLDITTRARAEVRAHLDDHYCLAALDVGGQVVARLTLSGLKEVA